MKAIKPKKMKVSTIVPLTATTMESPLGPLTLLANADALVAIHFGKEKSTPGSERHSVLKLAKKQLTEYFRKTRKNFDLPLAPQGSEFQSKAWKALRKIPFGKTVSYSGQAKRMGCEKAVRAVGTANGKNPLPIIIPCHRVIHAGGGMGGYTGGLDKKRLLLDHESSF